MHARRLPALGLAMLLAALVAGCAPATDPGVTVPPSARLQKVAVAYDLTGRGDGGFNDIAYNGVKEATDELGIELQEVTAKLDDTDDDRAERLRLLASNGFGAIIGVGFTYAVPMTTVAAEFPGVAFAIVDDATVDAPNVQGIVFAEQEGSFLVGAAGGLKTKTDTVGFIGAVKIPLLQKFEAGFTAGARAANPTVDVQVTYLSVPPDYSGFGDPPHGREAALGMYDNGVDVIFAAAGGSGAGVHEAASLSNHWSIGVDADEYKLSPEGIRSHILTSMLKNANVGTYAFLKAVADGTFEGGVVTYGLSNDGVGYAKSGGFVDDVSAQLDAYAADIVVGEIVVPETP